MALASALTSSVPGLRPLLFARWLWAAPSRGSPSPRDARYGRDCWSSETRLKADSTGWCTSPPWLWLWLWLSSGSPRTSGPIQGQPPPSE
eukprot:815627-Rhodomonas_salina.2